MNSDALSGYLNFPAWSNVNFSSPQGVQNAYNTAGQNAASVNQQNYNNILAGYQQMMAQQSAAWNNLQNRTMGMLKGANQSNIADINRRATARGGKMIAGLIDRGLANDTEMENLLMANAGLADRERTASRNAFAGTKAGFYSNIGAQGIGANMSLGLDQLHWMNSLNAPYPDAGLYAGLMRGYGGSGVPGMGGGATAGAIYPPMQGMHRFASDAIPAGYEAGYGYGGESVFDQSYRAAANIQPVKYFGYDPGYSYGGQGGDMNYGTQSSSTGYDQIYSPYLG